jgi:hypothetical protein
MQGRKKVCNLWANGKYRKKQPRLGFVAVGPDRFVRAGVKGAGGAGVGLLLYASEGVVGSMDIKITVRGSVL